MNDNNDKIDRSSPAAMAKRSFWIAVAGGVLAFICRFEDLGTRLQGLLSLIAIALLSIAFLIGLVALIRARSDDRSSVLMPALASILLGLSVASNLSYWRRDQWVKARARALERQNASQEIPLRFAAQPPPAKSTVKHELPVFDQIPEAQARIRSQATQLKGDDASVLRAWAAHLEKLFSAHTNALVASNKLHEVNLLDPKLVSNFENDEGTRRRRLANKYADAWHQISDKLSTFEGSFYHELHREQVSPTRTSAEAKAWASFLEKPEVVERIALLQGLCRAEKEFGHQYNYAASAVFDYARILHLTRTPSPGLTAQMEKQLAKLKEAEQVAADARQEVLAGSNPKS